jgi:hypothetical protein
VEQAGGLCHLAFHGAQLFAYTARGMIQNQIEVEDAGFNIA